MKQYNGEKAIISLTSWKKRINNVSRTIFSLITNCKGFHIVLVLCEEEFKNKEQDLPKDLNTLIVNNVIEVLWLKRNYNTFKKILFTMHKYKNVPVITADDGCIYINNYANTLYKKWQQTPEQIISFNRFNIAGIDFGGGGSGIIFPPDCFGNVGLTLLSKKIINTYHDDFYYGALSHILGIKWSFINKIANENNFKKLNDNSIGVTSSYRPDTKIPTIIQDLSDQLVKLNIPVK